MTAEHNVSRSSFAWNGAAWFGSQFGCTLWLLILGLFLFWKDVLSASVCVAGFAVLNAWGVYLWRVRQRLSAFAGLRRFLLAASVTFAVVVLIVNAREVSEPPVPGALVSTYLPYWLIGVAPALLLLFFLHERKAKRSQG